MFTSILICLFPVIVSAALFKFSLPTTPTLKPFVPRLLPVFAAVVLIVGVNLSFVPNAESAPLIVSEAIASQDNPVAVNAHLIYSNEEKLLAQANTQSNAQNDESRDWRRDRRVTSYRFDSVILNIILFVFPVIVAIVLFKFGIKTTPTIKPFAQRMLPAFALVILMLGANILFSSGIQSTLQFLIELPPITNRADFEQAQRREPIVVQAIASPDNPVRGKNNEYLAYVDDDGLWTPFDILLDLEDTQVEMTNDNYLHSNWQRNKSVSESNRLSYIVPGDTLTVFAEKSVSEGIAGEVKGQTIHSLEGILVYRGSHSGFVQNMKNRLWLPRIMKGLSAFALGATVLGVIIAAVKIVMTKPA